jgi:hypothetical protein
MNADIKGALEQVNKWYRVFEHRGQRMTKTQVKRLLEYGIKKGYEHTGEFTDEEVDQIIQSTNRKTQ